MSYKKIVVLSTSPLQPDGTFLNFQDGMYLGGHVRMEAAVKIAQNNPSIELVLTGGYNKLGEGDVQTSNKVNDMASFLRLHCPGAIMNTVYSLPCTHHNFVALLNEWHSQGIRPSEVGVLTNEYHMPRALEFARQALAKVDPESQLQFMPVFAEQILGKTVAECVGEDGMDAYQTRLESEARGLAQLRSGSYQDNCLSRNRDRLQTILSQRGQELLTPEEWRTLAV